MTSCPASLCSSNITSLSQFMSRRKRWGELVACMKYTRNVHKNLVRRSRREATPVRAPRHRRENNVKVCIIGAFG